MKSDEELLSFISQLEYLGLENFVEHTKKDKVTFYLKVIDLNAEEVKRLIYLRQNRGGKQLPETAIVKSIQTLLDDH